MSAKDTFSEPPELERLRDLSARIGCDRLLVRASSGNTSMKIDGVLWIKASGKWLIHADTADFLLPVQLARARACLETQTAIPETQQNSSGCGRASIETAMHAVLPQKVVIHVHSVNAIAWSVREDASKQLRNRLSGLSWQWVPYTRSGANLARRVQHICLRFPSSNVFIMGNHGLVVCGESCDSAEQLLLEVEQRLKIEVRPASAPCLSSLKRLAV
jgi:rhamnose utilization protein RhaD (predicted bifunctional aldolase and dehydrogenase)